MSGTRGFGVAVLGYDRAQVDAFRAEMDATVDGLDRRVRELQAELDHARAARPITAEQAFANVARETERILVSAQHAGTRIVAEARERAAAELAAAHDERGRLIEDGRRTRAAIEREVADLTRARGRLTRQLDEATAAVAAARAQLEARTTARIEPAVGAPAVPGAVPNGRQRTLSRPPGTALRLVTGDDRSQGVARRHAQGDRPRPAPSTAADPFAVRHAALSDPCRALTDLLGGELGALHTRLRERVRTTPDRPADAVIGPADVGHIADAGVVHLRRAFDRGVRAATTVATGDAGGAPLVDGAPPVGAAGAALVDDADGAPLAILHERIGGPLRRLVDDIRATDDPPWVVVERIDRVIEDMASVVVARAAESALWRAYERGKLAGWVHGDIVARRWVVSPRGHRADTACRTNADVGAVPVTAAFPSGEQTPPQHDRCTCTTIVADEESSP